MNSSMNDEAVAKAWRKLRDGSYDEGIAYLTSLYAQIDSLKEQLAHAKTAYRPERGHSDR